METSVGARAGPPQSQSLRFLALYALAAAGGSSSYAPFLTLILPLKMNVIAGPNAIEVLSYSAFLGAIAASLSNVLFGWASDRTRNRTVWILAGVLSSCTLLVSMRFVDTVADLLIMICAWQISLNMMLGPLAAWAGDCIPDHQKGLLGGLLSLAPGVGALTGALVTIPGLANGDERLVLIALVVSTLILPVLVVGRPRPMPHLMHENAPGASGPDFASPGRVAVWRMWLARLLMQIAEAALFAFLLLWLRDLDGQTTDNKVATIFSLVLLASVPAAIFAGRWSDRAGRPIFPLIVAGAGGALGLLIMAGSDTVWSGIAGYCIFGIAAAVFLALHSSQTLRVLPKPRYRGRDLGLFNLTNTVPSMFMPGLTLALVPHFGFGALFLVLALLVATSAMLLATRGLR
ncbi:MAG: MFS transporter [Tsuneonella sp.]